MKMDSRILKYGIQISHYAKVLPVDVLRLCEANGIETVPLSSLGKENAPFIFSMWGNSDGVALLSHGFYKIAYNDTLKTQRIRFTLAEEFCHIKLGHLKDESFQIGRQYDSETYQRYEQEAKFCASCLLCPPVTYFGVKRTNRQLMDLCDISEACAMTIRQNFEENRKALEMSIRLDPANFPKMIDRHIIDITDGYEL